MTIPNNGKSSIRKRKPARAEDWLTAPSPEDKKAACMKSTRIIFYSNGTFAVATNKCHRWDCELCAARRKREITQLVMSVCSDWYGVFIDGEAYNATKKRAERAGAEYCAVGTSQLWYFMTNQPILKYSKQRPSELAEKIINHVLQGPYTFHERRLRYSEGLFPDKPESTIDLEAQLVVREKVSKVRTKLHEEGYTNSWCKKFVDGQEVEGDMMKDILENGWFHVLWKE